jgi:lysophospholipase L1-like esterase
MGDSITQGVYSYWHNDVHTDANRYNGFDIHNLTSIAEETAYHGIHYYFGLLSGANVVNIGRRGTGWVADTRNIGNAIVMANDYDFSDVDFVALCFGVNDYIQGKTIGDISTQASNTIIGNMCATIEKILTDNPLCKVVVYTPYNTWGQVSKGGDYVADLHYGDESTNYALGHSINGSTLQDIINAMETVCMYYGIQCVNLSRSNVVNRFTLKEIMVDGLHPTKESYVKLAAEIYGKGNFGA